MSVVSKKLIRKPKSPYYGFQMISMSERIKQRKQIKRFKRVLRYIHRKGITE